MVTTPIASSDSGSGAAPSSGGLNYDAVQNYWLQAGGNAQAANMAAAVAEASSGLDPAITRTNPDGTTSVGLWLIPKNGQPPGSADPLANARAAKALSNNGTDWSQWCVTWSDNNCGQDGGTYLGSGANALAALASMNGVYNVIGSSVSGTNQGASAATTSTGTGTSTGSSGHTLLLIGLLVVIVLVVVYVSRRAQSSTPLEDVPG